MEPLSLDQLRHIVQVGRRDFMTGSQRALMLQAMLTRPEFKGISPKAAGEYLGNKVRFASYPQLKASADWIREFIGDEYFLMLKENKHTHAC